MHGTNVSGAWRYAYKWKGKTKRHYCGTWPSVALDQVRGNRDQAREWVKIGVNPSDQKREIRIEAQRQIEATLAEEDRRQADDRTVKDLYDAWITDGVRRSDDNAELKRVFQKDVLPQIGTTALRNLDEHGIRALLRLIVARGANRLALVVFTAIRQMLVWGDKRKPWPALLIEGNPTELIEIPKIVEKDYDLANIRDRVLSLDEIRELQAIFERMESEYAAAEDMRPKAAKTCLSRINRAAAWAAPFSL